MRNKFSTLYGKLKVDINSVGKTPENVLISTLIIHDGEQKNQIVKEEIVFKNCIIESVKIELYNQTKESEIQMTFANCYFPHRIDIEGISKNW